MVAHVRSYGTVSRPAARLLAAALLLPAGAAFRVAAREPAPAGETPWDEAEGRRLAAGSCDEWCNTPGSICDNGAGTEYSGQFSPTLSCDDSGTHETRCGSCDNGAIGNVHGVDGLDCNLNHQSHPKVSPRTPPPSMLIGQMT